jgi:hypothetical protein
MAGIVICAVCGKPIDANASRYVDIDPATKAKQQVHIECKK